MNELEARAELERWQQDSMRQAATINRLSAAAEDRNKVDQMRHDADETEREEIARQRTMRYENE